MALTQQQRQIAIEFIRARNYSGGQPGSIPSNIGQSNEFAPETISPSGVTYKNIALKKAEEEARLKAEAEKLRRETELKNQLQQQQNQFQTDKSYKDELNKLPKMTLQEKRIAELFNEVKGAPIGPWQASFFDTQIPNFNESGKLKEPSGIIDYLITKIAPEKTKKLATLASNLSDAQKIAFDIGGKTVSGTEAPITFGSFPTIYQEPDTFNNILNEYKKDLLRDKNEQLK
jgi:hypothetical protein